MDSLHKPGFRPLSLKEILKRNHQKKLQVLTRATIAFSKAC